MKLKWFTISEYVDIETGELINRNQYEKDYYKIKITKKIEFNENNGITKYITECRRTKQTRLFE